LRADATAPRKQRHTGHRIWERLLAEHGCTAAASTVRREVAQIRRELAPLLKQAFVPQAHEPGKEAEVDFYEAVVRLGGVERTHQHFCTRACHSGREFHLAFQHATQQAFLEAHNEALAHFGGVFDTVRYDNLKLAVKRVLQGRKREETDRLRPCAASTSSRACSANLAWTVHTRTAASRTRTFSPAVPRTTRAS
jgi:transposase